MSSQDAWRMDRRKKKAGAVDFAVSSCSPSREARPVGGSWPGADTIAERGIVNRAQYPPRAEAGSPMEMKLPHEIVLPRDIPRREPADTLDVVRARRETP